MEYPGKYYDKTTNSLFLLATKNHKKELYSELTENEYYKVHYLIKRKIIKVQILNFERALLKISNRLDDLIHDIKRGLRVLNSTHCKTIDLYMRNFSASNNQIVKTTKPTADLFIDREIIRNAILSANDMDKYLDGKLIHLDVEIIWNIGQIKFGIEKLNLEAGSESDQCKFFRQKILDCIKELSELMRAAEAEYCDSINEHFTPESIDKLFYECSNELSQ